MPCKRGYRERDSVYPAVAAIRRIRGSVFADVAAVLPGHSGVVAGREPVASLQHGDAAVQPVITYVHPIQPGVHALVRLEAVFAGILTDVAGILTDVAAVLTDVAGILTEVAGILTGECGLGLARWSDRCTCTAASVLPVQVGDILFIERAPVLFTSASEFPRPWCQVQSA
jgi:hypothetical protein